MQTHIHEINHMENYYLLDLLVTPMFCKYMAVDYRLSSDYYTVRLVV